MSSQTDTTLLQLQNLSSLLGISDLTLLVTESKATPPYTYPPLLAPPQMRISSQHTAQSTGNAYIVISLTIKKRQPGPTDTISPQIWHQTCNYSIFKKIFELSRPQIMYT